MARKEALLAYIMLLPAFLFVISIVLFPVLINVWMSFKSLTLAQLRSPKPVIKQKMVQAPRAPKQPLIVELDLRNTNTVYAVDNITLRIKSPAGLRVDPPRQFIRDAKQTLIRSNWTWAPGFRQKLLLRFFPTSTVTSEQLDIPVMGPLKITVTYQKSNSFFSHPFTIQNFYKVITKRDFFFNLWTTFIYSAGGAVGAILLGLAAAILAKNSLLGQGSFRALLLFPYVAPIIAATLIWVLLLDPFSGTFNQLLIQLGFIKEGIGFLSSESFEISFFGIQFTFPLALTSLICFDSWRYFPFTFLFILSRLGALSPQWYEAAKVDGAGPVQQFFRITLPQLMGVLTTLFILRFMWTFNKFDDVFLLTGGAVGTKTLPVQVYDYAFGKGNLGAGAAVAMVLFVFLALFLLLYSYYKPEGEE